MELGAPARPRPTLTATPWLAVYVDPEVMLFDTKGRGQSVLERDLSKGEDLLQQRGARVHKVRRRHAMGAEARPISCPAREREFRSPPLLTCGSRDARARGSSGSSTWTTSSTSSTARGPRASSSLSSRRGNKRSRRGPLARRTLSRATERSLGLELQAVGRSACCSAPRPALHCARPWREHDGCNGLATGWSVCVAEN